MFVILFLTTTSIHLQGNIGTNDWYKSEVEVTLNAIDNSNYLVGISKTEYSFNNSNWNTYSSPFTLNTEGLSTIYYRSIDNRVNIEIA
ncbi:MAG: hypothetical protein P1P85_04430, partial [Patescibacteria group bacterium]|nr:hypothetical protein [Patescibacteria group bacterium]